MIREPGYYIIKLDDSATTKATVGLWVAEDHWYVCGKGTASNEDEVIVLSTRLQLELFK